MTSPNPESNPNLDPTQNPADPTKPAAKPRRRRKWPWILLAFVVLLIVLVVLAPTIISTGPVRNLIASKVSDSINGSVKIGDMSLGWFRGTKLGGVKVYDSQGVLILEVNQLQTQLSLLDALRGDYNLGNTVVDANLTKCTVYEDGSTNYQKLSKSTPTEKVKTAKSRSPKEAGKLPNVSGNITVKYRGTIDGPGVQEVIHIEPSTATVKIPDINSPISDDVKLAFRLGDEAPATVSFAGMIDAVEDNQVIADLTKVVADQKLDLSNVKLAAAGPFLKRGGAAASTQPIELGGVANGSIRLEADGKSSASVQGAILVTNASFAGGPLASDRYTSSKLNLPVNVTATAVDSGTTVLMINNLGIQTDQANIALSGKATQQALENLADHKAPGSEGNLSLVLDVTNLPALAKELRNTLKLQKGVEITGGKIYSKTDLAIAKDHVTIAQDPNTVIEASGTNNGKAVALEPIKVTKLNVTAIPNGPAAPELRDLAINVATVFGTIDGGGASIADLAIHGRNFDLAKAQQQAAQFSDLGNVQLSGTGGFDVTTKGDPTQKNGNTTIAMALKLKDLIVKGIKDLEVQQQAVTANFAANYDGTTITFTQPLTAALENLTVAKVENGQPRTLLNNETINLRLNGKASMPKDGPTVADLSDLAVTSSSNLISIAKAGDRNITVALPKSGAFSGNGTLKIGSDLKRLNDLAQNFGGKVSAKTGAGQLTSGLLDATVDLDHPANETHTKLALDGTINNLSVTTNAEPIQNEKVTIALNATSPDDPAKEKFTVSNGSIDSSFAKIVLGETIVDLNAKNVFDKLVKTDLDIPVPSLPRLYALAEAFSPPAAPTTAPASTQPAEPLQITSGGAHVHLNVARDPNTRTTTITAPAFAVTKLGLARGQLKYAFGNDQDVNLKLAAAVTTSADGSKIEQIQVTDLDGSLAVAKVAMPEKITVTGLGTNNLSANGTIKLTGAIEQATPMLAVLEGKPAMSYAGAYELTQKVTTQQNQIALTGDVSVPKFQTDAKAQPQNFAVKNDLVAENFTGGSTGSKNLVINALNVSMPDTKALGVDVKGRLNDVENQRVFQDFKVNLSYELAQLWPIVKPMLSPEQQEQYKDMQIAGKFSREFNISGSYPANDPNAIKHLKADGALGIQSMKTNGLDLSIPELPFTLADGHFRTGKVAKQPTCNGGTLDLSGLDAELASTGTLVSFPKKYPLMRNVQLNPILADRLGSKANIIFKDATQAGGAVSVTINDFRNVPVSELTKHSGKPYNAVMTFSVTNLNLNGKVTQVLAQVLQLGNQGIVGEIRDALITLNDGFSKSDLPISIERKGKPEILRFSGTIDLATQKLQKDYAVNIASGLLGSDQLSRYLSGGIVLPIKGTLSNWSIDTSRLVEAESKSALQGLIPGKGNDNKATGEQKQENNPLGGLLQQLEGKDKQDNGSSTPATPKKKKKQQ